jgi:hypothetical protein
MVQGLYVVTDMYPFHLQARKVGLLVSADTVIYAFLAYKVEHMDDGLHRFAIFIALCVWFSCGSG